MSSTLFGTNNLNLLDSFLMYPDTISLSVQIIFLLTGISNLFLKGIDIFNESDVATNFILGMVITFNGAKELYQSTINSAIIIH